MRGWTMLASFTAIAAITACSGDSSLKDLADYDLAQRQAQCLDKKPTSPGHIQACKNIQRECDRRRTELGLYICRTH